MAIQAVLFDMFDTLMLIVKDHEFYDYSLKKAHSFLVENGVDVAFAVFHDAYTKARDALYVEADVQLEEPHFNLRISKALESLGYSFGAYSEVVAGATNEFCEGFMEYVRIDDHAKSALEKLRKRYKLGIVSNFALPECVDKLLERHGLEKFLMWLWFLARLTSGSPAPKSLLNR
jgi:FMN phosphatase YigB (HAD superfamily)